MAFFQNLIKKHLTLKGLWIAIVSSSVRIYFPHLPFKLKIKLIADTNGIQLEVNVPPGWTEISWIVGPMCWKVQTFSARPADVCVSLSHVKVKIDSLLQVWQRIAFFLSVCAWLSQRIDYNFCLKSCQNEWIASYLIITMRNMTLCPSCWLIMRCVPVSSFIQLKDCILSNRFPYLFARAIGMPMDSARSGQSFVLLMSSVLSHRANKKRNWGKRA